MLGAIPSASLTLTSIRSAHRRSCGIVSLRSVPLPTRAAAVQVVICSCCDRGQISIAPEIARGGPTRRAVQCAKMVHWGDGGTRLAKAVTGRGTARRWFVDYIPSCEPVPHEANGTLLVSGRRASPLMPAGFPVFSMRSRNGLMMSIGIGKTMVEFCSAPISVSVCR
jgi:hypothetical protein